MADHSVKNILLVFLIIVVFYLLSVLSPILIPLAFAFLFAILFAPLIDYLKSKKIPNFLILPVLSVISLSVLFLMLNIIFEASGDIALQQDYLLSRLEMKFNSLVVWVNDMFGYKFKLDTVFTNVEDILQNKTVSKIAGNFASGISAFAGSILMFAIYYVVLLSGLSNTDKYLQYVGGDNSGGKLLEQFKKIQKSIVSYMLIKTLISLGTGVLVYGICLAFGIKFPELWAFTTFLLNFIPSVGSILASIPPMLMGVIQFDSLNLVMFLLLCLAIVQFVMGNVIEPIIMGNKLSLNTLTVLFGLVFWGYLWGVPGMMLSVPLLVFFKISISQSPSLSFVARLMGNTESN